MNVNPIKIRYAAEADLDSLYDIWKEGAAAAVSLADVPTDPLNRSMLASRVKDRSDVNVAWVACDSDGTVLGWQSLTPRSNPQNYKYVVESSTYVRRRTRIPGIARELLGTALRHAASTSIQYVYGFTSRVNKPSKMLMQHFGFTHVGDVPAALKPPTRDGLEFWVYVVPVQYSENRLEIESSPTG